MSDVFVTVIKVLASLSALYMCLSPSTSMYRIHKQRATGPSSIVPLVALWGCNHMWMLYGYVTDNIFPLMVTYVVGDVTSVLFIAVFYRYTTERRIAIRVCVGTLLINAVVAVYAVLGKTGTLHQSQHDVKLIVGIFAIASSIILYASPFATIKHVVTSKSSESIPFAMVSVGIANNALWIIYGFLIDDMLLVIPTVVNILIGVVQFVLYFVYHPKRQKLGAPVASGVAGAGGAIEIVTDGPRLTQRAAVPVSIEASGFVDDSHLTKTNVPQSDELTLSVVQLEAEASYVEVKTPGRFYQTSSSATERD